MSYVKIKIITPENPPTKNPEKDYVYLGYGYSSTYDTIAPWIKKDDGSIILINSGGTGGGGTGSTTLYWQKDGSLLKPSSPTYRVQMGSDSSDEFLTVEGAIKIGNATGDDVGTIKYENNNFYGNTGGTPADWVSLTEPEGSGGGTSSPWTTISSWGIGYLAGKVYIGGGFTSGPWDGGGYLNVQGETKVDSNILIGAKKDDSSYSTDTYKAHVSGGTVSEGFLSKFDKVNEDNFVTDGGFGGYSGGTISWGLTGTFTLTTYDSSYKLFIVDIVNGLIVNIRDGGRP